MPLILVSCACASASIAAPAAATGCPSFAKVSQFQGTASLAFSQTATGPDGAGGTQTVSLSHSATLQFTSVTPVSGTSREDWQGQPSGGNVGVNDTLSDTNGGQTTTGTQSGGGAPTAQSEGGIILSAPDLALFGSCPYVISARFSITTTTSDGQQHTLSEFADSPVEQIPSDLELKGTATFNAYCTVPTGTAAIAALKNGEYRLDASNGYDGAYCAAANAGTGQPVGTASISWSFSPVEAECVVPNLIGKTLAAAKTALTSASCTLGKVASKSSTKVAAGHVISSNPGAGKKLAVGAKVDLTLSAPPCVVPHLAGEAAAGASSTLAAAGCTLGKVTKTFSASVGKGKIISSTPNAGSKLAAGAAVAISVSLGPPKLCTVPKTLPGKTLPQAKVMLIAADCSVGAITTAHSSTFTKGTVITSKPKPGTKKLPAFQPVALILSLGP